MRRFSLLLLLTVFPALADDPQRGKLTENVVTQGDPNQSYTLFLPSTYDPARRHPLLLVFDPRGRGTFTAELFRAAAEEHGWIILSSNGTRSDDGPEHNDRALKALLPEIPRYAVDSRRVYATGFSGTAMLAWTLGIHTGGLAGVISVGGRLVEGIPPAKFPFANYGFAGDTDFNNREMRAIDAILEREGKPHRFRQFPGPHSWMDASLAADAIGWFEVLAMKDGKRTRDEVLLTRLFERERAAAASSSPRDALRIERAMVQTYEDLLDLTAIRADVTRLERDPAVLRALEEEAKADRFEEQYIKHTLGRVGAVIADLRGSGEKPTAIDIRRELRIGDLKRMAEKGGAEGLAAKRLLESAFSQLGSYLMRQFMAREEFALAAVTLTVATEIHPDRWFVWYNLGCAHARAGDRRRALDSLEKAISLGFNDAKHLATDEDLASLRKNERFKGLVAKLDSASGE